MGKIPLSDGTLKYRMRCNSQCMNISRTKFVSITVFILFFGIALIEALQKQNWLEAMLFMALGILSLWADFHKK